jgi:hypothetical protein
MPKLALQPFSRRRGQGWIKKFFLYRLGTSWKGSEYLLPAALQLLGTLLSSRRDGDSNKDEYKGGNCRNRMDAGEFA